jgi:hypothetical protein
MRGTKREMQRQTDAAANPKLKKLKEVERKLLSVCLFLYLVAFFEQ